MIDELQQLSKLNFNEVVEHTPCSTNRVVPRRFPSSLAIGIGRFFSFLKTIIRRIYNVSYSFHDLPSFSEAALLSTMIIAIMALCIIKFDSVPHMPILLAILLLITYGLMKKVPYKKLEEGLADGAKAGLGAIFIFFFIGILVSSLMMSGTIPTLIHLGFQFITPHFFMLLYF